VSNQNGKRNAQRTVVITGASAGVGRATVREFAREGARIGLIARGQAGLEGAKHDAERLGGQAIILPTDVADANKVEAAAEKTEEEFGPIDVWVNVAMTSVFSPLNETKPEEFKRVMEVNYLGFVYGTLSALRRMLPRDRGVIVQVGSALAYRGIPLQAAYCASKHAIQGFMDSLHCELIHDRSNVKACMVQMPALNTPQFSWVKSRLPRKPQPVPPIYQPEVAARAIHYASLHPRREMFVGGSTVKAIVGNRLMPGVLDWYLGRTGYEAQQYDGEANPSREFNLWDPVDVDEDHGAHGSFDARATSSAPELWASMNRSWLLAGAAGLAAAGVGAWLGGKIFEE
jgi:NAD(P)-dependent dehydrogenase (short-subunit alcohol dehydrogenase family)